MLSYIDVGQVTLQPRKLASRCYSREVLNAMLDEETGEMMEYQHLIGNSEYREIWDKSYENELGQLAQGMPGRVDRTNKLCVIDKQDIPSIRLWDVTYGRILVSYWPEKKDPNKVRLTVGCDRVNYPDDCSTPTANMLTIKLIFNSVISTPREKIMTIDIKISIAVHRFQDMSTCDSNWKTSRKISLRHTNSKRRSQRMDISMSKFVKECMDYPNQEC